MSDSLLPHGLQDARPLCTSPTPGVYSDSCPLSWWLTLKYLLFSFPFFSSSFRISPSQHLHGLLPCFLQIFAPISLSTSLTISFKISHPYQPSAISFLLYFSSHHLRSSDRLYILLFCYCLFNWIINPMKTRLLSLLFYPVTPAPNTQVPSIRHSRYAVNIFKNKWMNK